MLFVSLRSMAVLSLKTPSWFEFDSSWKNFLGRFSDRSGASP